MNWEPHLKPGERLLWSGRPRGGFFSGDLSHDGLLLFVVPFGVFGLLIALNMFAETGVAWGAPLLLPMLWMAWLLRLDHRDRSTAHYAVTDQRVLIARSGTACPVAWFSRSAHETIVAHHHILHFSRQKGTPVFVTAGSFQHRFFNGHLFFERGVSGKLPAITLLDLEDAFEVLQVIRNTGELDTEGTEDATS